MSAPRVIRIAGAVVDAQPFPGAALYELCHVGARHLLAEVVRTSGDVATLQVYEDTTGLAIGEPVEPTGRTLMAALGPGLLGTVMDGIGRPLARVAESAGDFLMPGVTAPTLATDQRWRFSAERAVGESVTGGDVLGTVEERPGFAHRVLVPVGVSGRIAELRSAEYGVGDPIGRLDDGTPLLMTQQWPVRRARPIAQRLPMTRPFVTGQRVFDLLFPVAEGGSAAVPGGFGTGKTLIEQSLAKFADADVIVFVGCGERGNEMTEVLTEFPALIDPRTGRRIMDRAVLIVNTSNMPVAAREASIYLGVTIAEYYRDMGHRVALMVDSTSRWAEALRELAARLQEMPAEEGYPTSLSARLGQFLERSGRAQALGSPQREGAVTIIGAISPPGGDFSEPVTQAALRVTGAVWALDPSLAHQRHFPAVDWETSYTLYANALDPWLATHAGADWPALRTQVLALLQRERELRDIAALVGPESLEERDRLTLVVAAIVRELVLRQNAYDPADAESTLDKTYALVRVVAALMDGAERALQRGVALATIVFAPVRRALVEVRGAPAAELAARASAALAAAHALGGEEPAP